MVRAVAGDLGRPIEVHECGVGQGCAPTVELLGRHDFARERHEAHGVGHGIIEPAHNRHEAHCAHCPYEHGWLAFDQVIEKLRGYAKVIAWNQVHGRAQCKRPEHVFD